MVNLKVKWPLRIRRNGETLLAFGLLLLPTCYVSCQTSRVQGVVTNRATGESLAGVRLILCEDKGDLVIPICPVAMSAADGSFFFAGPKAGLYRLMGEKTGFLKDYFAESGQGSSFQLRRASSRRIHLSLWPEASISGRVLDENEKPIAGVTVSAIREGYAFGRRYLEEYQYWGDSSATESKTKRDGTFQIAEMTPGKYYLQASCAAFPELDDSLLGKCDALTYFPGSGYLPKATLLAAEPGEKREVVFRLRPGPLYSVRGSLEVPLDFNRDFEPLYALSAETGVYLSKWKDKYNHKTRSFELGPLPQGDYRLGISSGIYPSDLTSSVSFSLVDADLDGLKMRMRQPFTLLGRIHLPAGFHSKTSYSTLLSLTPDGTSRLDKSGRPVKDGDDTWSDLMPGHYRLRLFTDDPLYLKSAFLGSEDVLAQGFTLGDPPHEVLELTLFKSIAEVRGTVFGLDGVPASGADVKLISKGEDAPFVWKSMNADEKGQFLFSGVAPGAYDVVALDEAIRDWEFGPDEFAQVSRSATHFEIDDKSEMHFDLRVAKLRYQAPADITESTLIH